MSNCQPDSGERTSGRTEPLVPAKLLASGVVIDLCFGRGAPLHRRCRAAPLAPDARIPAGRGRAQRGLRHREHPRARAPQAQALRALRRRRVARRRGKRKPQRAVRRAGLTPRRRDSGLEIACSTRATTAAGGAESRVRVREFSDPSRRLS